MTLPGVPQASSPFPRALLLPGLLQAPALVPQPPLGSEQIRAVALPVPFRSTVVASALEALPVLFYPFTRPASVCLPGAISVHDIAVHTGGRGRPTELKRQDATPSPAECAGRAEPRADPAAELCWEDWAAGSDLE